MSFAQENDQNATTLIDSLQFGILGPDEIRSMSVAEINNQQQFENGRPVRGGVFDSRMGTISRAIDCETCHQDRDSCPGHFGHIELQIPVIHPFYIEIVKKVLTCVCYRCSRLLIVKDAAFLRSMKAKVNPKLRLAAIYTELSKKPVRVCGYCGFKSTKTDARRKRSSIAMDGSSASQKTDVKKAKHVNFIIGRGAERFSRLKPNKNSKGDKKPLVQGSGSVFGKAVSSFSIEPKIMPTKEELKEDEDACSHIQPNIVHENTNILLVWPEAPRLYSFLLRGTTDADNEEDREEEEENEDDDDEQNAQDEEDDEEKTSRKRKRRTAPKKRKKIKDATNNDVRRMLNGSPFKLPASAKPGEREELSSKRILEILSRISAEDAYLLGFDPLYAHPSWVVLTVLPVLPPNSRPQADTSKSAGSSNGKHISLDDISFKYIQLVKKNIDLSKQRTHEDVNLKSFQLLVKHHVMTLICNKIRGQSVARRTPKGPPLESLTEHWKGKHGRIRGVMLGKRVNFTSRCVVGCSPGLRSDQLGVPAKVSRILTVPETVNRFNIERLQECVNAGPNAYRGGANYVQTCNGDRLDLKMRRHVSLRVGYTVHRHLKKDDILVFNRQPSLHRMSMMGHRVVIHDENNFKLNLSVTTPYNADFDGDEMNAHAPQSMAANVEIRELMMVPTQFITPQHNAPIIGVVQDCLLASRLFTQRDNFLTRAQVCQLLMVISHEDDCEETRKMIYQKTHNKKGQFALPMPAILAPQPLWTGKQIFSLLLPTDLEYSKRSRGFSTHKAKLAPFLESNPTHAKYCDPCDTMTIVRGGELLCGVIDKKSIGATGGSFVHIVFNDHGGERCRDMIDAVVRCMSDWLSKRGFSVSLSDMSLPEENMQHIEKIKKLALEQVEKLSQDMKNGTLEQIPGQTVEEAFETKINETLNRCRDEIGNYIQRSLPMGNQLKMMEEAGSKGNLTNLSSTIGSVGQGNINGQRMSLDFYGRSTPHALPDDLSDVKGRGFVASSFKKGLGPLEFVAQAKCGREGLTHTAVRTSDSGYIQRRFINTLADLKVVNGEGQVCNSVGQIVQFGYGEDNMDAVNIEQQKFNLLLYDDAEMLRNYYVGKCLTAEELQKHVLPHRSLEACKTTLEKLGKQTEQLDCDQKEALVEIKFMFDARDYLREHVFRGEARDYIYLPKSLSRLVERSRHEMLPPSDLVSVASVRKQLGRLLTKMMDSKNGPLNTAESDESLYARYATVGQTRGLSFDENRFNCFKVGQPQNELLAALYVHYLLSPKRAIQQHKLSEAALQWVCDQYATEFFKSRAEAGDSVGTIAAQSLGSPTTQMTLNSVTRETQLLLENGRIVQIGNWIDEKMRKHKKHVVVFENDTEYLDLKTPIQIPTCDENGTVFWSELTAVTRHPPRGDLVCVKTKSGKSVCVTKCKSLLVFDCAKRQFVPKCGAEISIGDQLPAIDNLAKVLKRMDAKSNAFCDPVVSVDFIDEKLHMHVYDVTVPKTLNFVIANGLGLRDTFHSAGVSAANVTLGFPRLKELAAASEKTSTPITHIFFSGTDHSKTQVAKKMAAWMPHVAFEDIVQETDVLKKTPEQIIADVESNDRQFVQLACQLDPLLKNVPGEKLADWAVRFVLNRSEMQHRGYSTTVVAATLRAQLSDWALVVASDDNHCDNLEENGGGVIWLFFLREPMLRELVEEKPDSDALLDATAMEDVTPEQWKDYCGEQYADRWRRQCYSMTIGGVKDIKGAAPVQIPVVRYCQDTGSLLEKQKEWLVQAQGLNLETILSLPGVDHTRTICNNSIEVHKVLGIEAARAVLLDEFRQVMSFNGSYVNYRHLALLVDTMTHTGKVTAITSHAFRKKPTGPYTRAAFEQQTNVLRDAGIYSEFEDGNDVRSAIMIGKRIPQGTGSMFDTLVSVDAIKKRKGMTMDEICAKRRRLEIPENPFGFTGELSEEDENDTLDIVEFENDDGEIVESYVSNPFLSESKSTSLNPFESVAETNTNEPVAKFTGFRPDSPSRYFQ